MGPSSNIENLDLHILKIRVGGCMCSVSICSMRVHDVCGICVVCM